MRKYKSYFDTFTLKIDRKEEDSGHLDINNNWVEGEEEFFDAVGDLQPYIRKPGQQLEASEGFTLKDAKVFSTKTELRTIDDYRATSADRTKIDNRTYYVAQKMDWTGSVLDTDYRDYILMLEAIPDKERI